MSPMRRAIVYSHPRSDLGIAQPLVPPRLEDLPPALLDHRISDIAARSAAHSLHIPPRRPLTTIKAPSGRHVSDPRGPSN
jgi:hypothetical protein